MVAMLAFAFLFPIVEEVGLRGYWLDQLQDRWSALAIIVFGLYVLAGFVVLAAALSIPQHDGCGIRFSPRQRKLLGYGVVAPIAGVLIAPIGATLLPPLGKPVLSVLVGGGVGLLVGGPLATLRTLLAVGLKLREWLSAAG